jgi:putative hydrolase of the HAD superfamily
MPKAVVFDFGGVMTERSDRDSIFHYIGTKVKSSKNDISIESISFTSFIEELIGVNKKMYNLVNQLKNQNVFVVLFSNIDRQSAKTIRDAGFYKPFDLCLLSCEIGAKKPSYKAYNILLNSLSFPIEEIVFIDDIQENIEAAKNLGIDAILFQSPEQIVYELSERGLK